jgi:methylmalonyl-CoA mutase cobalamin-binding domain/chain
VVLGGIIPAQDRAALIEAGVSLIIGPGEPLAKIVHKLDELLKVGGGGERDPRTAQDR